jgi:hypothetical protein
MTFNDLILCQWVMGKTTELSEIKVLACLF